MSLNAEIQLEYMRCMQSSRSMGTFFNARRSLATIELTAGWTYKAGQLLVNIWTYEVKTKIREKSSFSGYFWNAAKFERSLET